MRLILLKSQKFAHQAGYYLQNGRWHKASHDKPAPKGAAVSAHPHAAGKPVQKETLAEHEWAQLKLPAENVNAKTFNKQLDQLKAAAAAGDITGIVGSGYGTNTYGKKLTIIANHLLGLLGSDHKVTPGQKAGTHAAVQTAPEIEAEAPAPKPEKPSLKEVFSPATKEIQDAVAGKGPSQKVEKKAGAELAVPEFAEGKQAKGVKAHYEKVAKKIIRAAKAGDLSALQFMAKPENGNTWKGKTDNSKKLLELHQAAIAHVQAQKGQGKDVQHPDAEKQAAQEAKELAKEGVKPEPEKKPEPKKDAEPKKFKNYGWKAIDLAKHYTIPELEAAMKDVEAEHAGTGTGIQLYDKAGQKKLDALTWAITHIAGAEKKAAADKAASAEVTPKEGETKQGADGTLVFQNGRWHKQAEQQKAELKPAAKEQPKGDAAANLSQIPWDSMLLPDSNKNAKSHNKQVAKIKAMAEAGDIEGLKNFKAGVNTYGKKQNLLAQTALAALEESAPAPKAEAKPAPAETPKAETAPDAEPKIAAPAADGKPQKPTGLSSVHWNSVVNDIEEKMAAKDIFPISQVEQQTKGLESEEAKKVHAYAAAAVSHLLGEASAGLENDGPQEGETKQGADGMLVFKNGRWHKMGEDKAPADKAAAEKPAPAGPADVEIPEFTGLSPNHLNSMNKAAAALKKKISEEGKAGFKSVLTNHKDGKVTVTIDGIKISKASVTSGTPAFAAFAKFVDELKASTGATKKPKAAPKAKPAPAPAAEPEQQKPIESMDSWTQTGGQGGSNPGGKFKDENGVEWYCKFPENDHVAKAEVLAAKLYGALGLNSQDAKLITKDGKVGIASRWQDVKKATPKELAKTPGVLEGFAADAWLANWDVVGMAYDNLQVDDKGHAMRVDAGGSLMYRAQGGKKAFGDHVTELDSLRDPKLNPQAAAVFGQMSDADITASVAKVAQISDAQIRIMVNNFGPGDKAERKVLAETLIARKNDLIAKYPKAVKVKKKRLDPENLPVKEDRLPKEHDFANWNGPGAGLSSKAAVNAANQKVESEMLDIAKSGNLNKLKDYKFQPVDIATGEPKGEPIPVAQHPSKHVQQFHQDLIQALDEIANPPQPLKIFQESDLSTLDELDMAFPSKKFGTTVNSVHSNEKMGFWVVLGGVHNAAEKFMPKKISHFTTAAVEAAYKKFKEGSKLAKHFILSVQASGSYNDLFREGKEFDHQGNKLSDVAKAAMEYATEQPEGTAVYRWQHMTKDMVDKIMGAPEGTVFQATGSMCTSMSPTDTSHFGPHRIKIVYAKGAKAVDSFGSGKFAGEKEVTTLPNSRFVIMKKEMVPDEKSKTGGKRLELEVLMLPPDIGL